MIQKPVGEIYLYSFRDVHPKDGETGSFIVYPNNGNPCMCIWRDNAFWYAYDEYRGKDANWQVVTEVEYWFRIPQAEEIVNAVSS